MMSERKGIRCQQSRRERQSISGEMSGETLLSPYCRDYKWALVWDWMQLEQHLRREGRGKEMDGLKSSPSRACSVSGIGQGSIGEE